MEHRLDLRLEMLRVMDFLQGGAGDSWTAAELRKRPVGAVLWKVKEETRVQIQQDLMGTGTQHM